MGYITHISNQFPVWLYWKYCIWDFKRL